MQPPVAANRNSNRQDIKTNLEFRLHSQEKWADRLPMLRHAVCRSENRRTDREIRGRTDNRLFHVRLLRTALLFLRIANNAVLTAPFSLRKSPKHLPRRKGVHNGAAESRGTF